jgi:BMFP domain-containing protein YqiC
MLPNFQVDEITKKILEALPTDFKSIEHDVRQKIKLVVQSTLSKMDVVNREEFDIQTQVLARTREKVETLEKQLQDFIQRNPFKS